MQKIFEEYGGVIVTVIAVVALITLVTVLMNEGGPLHDAFDTIIDNFVAKTTAMVNATPDTNITAG